MPPNSLTDFELQNPNATWEDFRNQARQSYDNLKQQMLAEQGGLCAYCEKKISHLDTSQQRIEHFHNKSDISTAHNWALDWNNVLLVCIGGANPEDKENYAPDHLSCDSHKEQVKQVKGLPDACEGWFINPTQIQTIARLFDFDKATGKLLVNCVACQQLVGLPNQYGADWCMLAEKTIEILNLNCQRLCDDRLEVLISYNQRVKMIREKKIQNGLQQFAQDKFSQPFPEFFTTWRSLLGKHAENYLTSIQYNG